MQLDTKLILEHSKKLNVLYVEDEDIVRNSTKKIFSMYFKEVDIAIDGQEGLEKFLLYKRNNDEYYDIVISDSNMPRMSGIKMCAAIIDENPQQFIIFNTADTETSLLQNIITVGVDNFLSKPINLNQLKLLLYRVTQAISNPKTRPSYSFCNQLETNT